MRVAVVGLWHLGTVTAACLTSVGHQVVAFDDGPTIRELREGRLPVLEPGLGHLVQAGVAAGALRFTSDPGDLRDVEVVWVTYDTPVDDDDRADVEYVTSRVERLCPHLGEGALVLISSQLPVGLTRRLEERCRAARPDRPLSFGYSPENLRLGHAIEAFTRPERVVVGVRTAADRRRVVALLEPITTRIEWTSVESAEMTKHALNAFLATSVAFANELATLCERTGADAGEVERALRADPRVGPHAYVRPGAAFAGGTLARDVSYLVGVGRREGLPTLLFEGVIRSNAQHKAWAHRRLGELIGDLRGRKVAVLGLTYKPGTDTLRRSSAVETCRWLHDRGAVAAAYDPAVSALPAELAEVVDLRPTIQDAVQGSAALFVATEWPEFAAVRADDLVAWMPEPLVLDPGRFLEPQLGTDRRIRYLAVGRGT